MFGYVDADQRRRCECMVRPVHVRFGGYRLWVRGLGQIAAQLGTRSMTEKLRPSAFHCPHCAAKYALVKVEAVSPVEAKVRCLSCGGPLDSRENAFVLKYFLVERPRATISGTI